MSIYTFCVLGWVVLFVADVESFDTIDVPTRPDKRIDRGIVIGPGVFKGKLAAANLLKNARPVLPNRLASRKFTKSGTYQHALRDFKSVGPSNVKEYTLPGSIHGMTGQAGDLKILVENTGPGQNGKVNAIMKLFHKLQDVDKSRIDQINYQHEH